MWAKFGGDPRAIETAPEECRGDALPPVRFGTPRIATAPGDEAVASLAGGCY